MSDRPSDINSDLTDLNIPQWQAFLRDNASSPPPPHPHLENQIMQAVAAHPHPRPLGAIRSLVLGLIALSGIAGTFIGVILPVREAQLARQEMEQLEDFISANWDDLFQEPEFQVFLEETHLTYQTVAHTD